MTDISNQVITFYSITLKQQSHSLNLDEVFEKTASVLAQVQPELADQDSLSH